jgi:hypothetical protein
MRIKVTSLAILHQKRGMGYRKKEKSERIKEQKALVFKKKERMRKRK